MERKARKALEERVALLERQLGLLHVMPRVFYAPDNWDELADEEQRELYLAEGIQPDLDKVILVRYV
jgi:hypothetical protein